MNRHLCTCVAVALSLATLQTVTAQTSSTPGKSLNGPAASPSASHSEVVGFQAQLTGGQVGYRVYAQEWNPQKPAEDTPTSVVDKPSGISGPINALWDATRQFLSDRNNPSSVPSLLGKADLIAKGVTLYDITFTVNKLSALDLQGPQSGVVYAGQNGSGPRSQMVTPNSFSLHLHIPATTLDFRSTTPDFKGIGAPRDADPHLSAQIDLDVVLGLAVGAPGQPYLQVTNVQVTAGKANVDSHNFTGDVMVGITNFLSNLAYGKSFNALLDQILADHNLAADPAHGGFAFGAVKTFDMKAMANDYLRPVNDTVAASGVTRYVRTGVWVKSQQSGRMLTALFAPQALPLPPLKGGMSGIVLFEKVPAAKMPSSCDKLVSGDRLDVEVQTGPRPVLDVDPFNYGKAPVQRLTNVAFTGQAVQGGQCTYALNGLALGYPNNIQFKPPTLANNGSVGNIAQYISLSPENWTVLPMPSASNGPLPQGFSDVPNRNIVASMSFASNTGAGAMQANPAGLAHETINPVDPAAKWGGTQQVGQPATGPNWGAPGAAAAKPANARTTSSQPRPGAAPSSLGASEQRQ